MPLSLPETLAIAMTCAPQIAPETLLSIVEAESRFNPLAIGVNRPPGLAVAPRTATEATAQASALIAAGRSIDLGLTQINSANLGPLGLSVEAAFDPCRNLAASARLLQADYARSHADAVGVQRALRTTLSFYNTGDPQDGFANGYVARVTAAAARIVPALEAGSAEAAPPSEPATPHPSWDVFGQMGAPSFVIRISTTSPGAAP